MVVGILLMIPSELGPQAFWTDVIGVVAGAVIFGSEYMATRRVANGTLVAAEVESGSTPPGETA